ncbi:hypothetical protein Tcan_13890 [Toxocara canis]|uniref:Uncharacterized protein n=1 Tax=Toxocara canis TaxID=6265 RepID=A0A0B2V1V4_TOXCA|nr:hypothetical protein Tcan_13890 [Toxocara canis]
MLTRICTFLIAAVLVLNVEAGTWLSFNQKTAGLGDDFASQSFVPVADLARLVRSCDEELIGALRNSAKYHYVTNPD